MKSKKDPKNKNIEKNNAKGITLIALVITIIVLLILAGVSIAMLTGDNGIITQANKSKVANEKATAKEKVQVEVGGSRGTDGKLDYELLKNNLKNVKGIENAPDSIETGDFPLEVTVDGYTVTIADNGTVTVEGETAGGIDDIKGKYYATDTTITVGGQTVAIPGGATVSGIDGEYESVDDGLVIYITNGAIISDWSEDRKNVNANKNESNGIKDVQEEYDQFVWVPVKNPVLDLSTNPTALENETNIKNAVKAEITAGRYPMAIKKSEEEYFGVLYKFTEEGGIVKIEPHSDWTPLSISGYREPNTVSDDSSNGITSLQGEYKTMIESVEQNEGFWVGRYETSKMNTNDVEVVRNTIDAIDNVDWYKMYEGQKTYKTVKLTKSASTTSSMIWGSQWDQIMIWMKDIKNGENYYITNSVGMGNFGNPELETGKEGYDVKNIYDLAGNVYDLTIEGNGGNYRVFRGGLYDYTTRFYARADNRGPWNGSSGDSGIGSRFTLY